MLSLFPRRGETYRAAEEIFLIVRHNAMDFAREGGSHGARRRAREFFRLFFPGFVQERSPMLRAMMAALKKSLNRPPTIGIIK